MPRIQIQKIKYNMFSYYMEVPSLSDDNNIRIKVCQKDFLNFLGLKKSGLRKKFWKTEIMIKIIEGNMIQGINIHLIKTLINLYLLLIWINLLLIIAYLKNNLFLWIYVYFIELV